MLIIALSSAESDSPESNKQGGDHPPASI